MKIEKVFEVFSRQCEDYNGKGECVIVSEHSELHIADCSIDTCPLLTDEEWNKKEETL